MNLVTVSTPPHFQATCIGCQRQAYTDEVTFYADLDGEPFIAYYCVGCAKALIEDASEVPA